MTLLTSAKKIIHFVATAMLVVACGGGGSSSQIAGIDRLGITTGAVTGFGSIFVNGIEYETDNADFTIDDDSVGSSQANLAVGDVVVITFDTSASNVALAVVADEAARDGDVGVTPQRQGAARRVCRGARHESESRRARSRVDTA